MLHLCPSAPSPSRLPHSYPSSHSLALILISPCLSSSVLLSLSLSQSIASCLFSSLREAQHFSGRSGSWLHCGEAIKTTADWNRLREQRCKLKGAYVVEQGVNSNRLAPWNKEAHTSHHRGDPCVSALCVCPGKLSLHLSDWTVLAVVILSSIFICLVSLWYYMAELSKWANEDGNTINKPPLVALQQLH